MIARAGISSVPIVGGAGVELFSALVTPPLERRRNEWMEEVGNALRDIEKKADIKLKALAENDAFIDTTLTASQIAVRTSQEEKRKVLINAISNVALEHAPEESRQHFFLNLIDIFTVWHLKILDLFDNPRDWLKRNERPEPNIYMRGMDSLLEEAYPELKEQRDFYDQVWKDLNTYGLTNTNSLHTVMSLDGILSNRTSDLGKEFIKFINTPIELKKEVPPGTEAPGYMTKPAKQA